MIATQAQTDPFLIKLNSHRCSKLPTHSVSPPSWLSQIPPPKYSNRPHQLSHKGTRKEKGFEFIESGPWDKSLTDDICKVQVVPVPSPPEQSPSPLSRSHSRSCHVPVSSRDLEPAGSSSRIDRCSLIQATDVEVYGQSGFSLTSGQSRHETETQGHGLDARRWHPCTTVESHDHLDTSSLVPSIFSLKDHIEEEVAIRNKQSEPLSMLMSTQPCDSRRRCSATRRRHQTRTTRVVSEEWPLKPDVHRKSSMIVMQCPAKPPTTCFKTRAMAKRAVTSHSLVPPCQSYLQYCHTPSFKEFTMTTCLPKRSLKIRTRPTRPAASVQLTLIEPPFDPCSPAHFDQHHDRYRRGLVHRTRWDGDAMRKIVLERNMYLTGNLPHVKFRKREKEAGARTRRRPSSLKTVVTAADEEQQSTPHHAPSSTCFNLINLKVLQASTRPPLSWTNWTRYTHRAMSQTWSTYVHGKNFIKRTQPFA